ncbi:PTS sugar transporter subunit IIB [Lacticaseibacillus paracasei]|uniref:PTS sugar transporter subunit IIB n=1 Tax=Lacticaseibacillus paracasei TaxID=1597 RepID=UPI00235EE7ED|nr:PTS sugar transporter subunit IIB [Lacticaseibacillus paracasei]
MKKVLVVCGNGIASSSIMLAGLKDYLRKQGIEADLDKASLSEVSDDTFNSKDLIVSSTKLNKPNVTTPVIIGSSLLTGIGEDETLEKIKEMLLE